VRKVLGGVVTAVWIRKVLRPARFKGSHRGEADVILGMIALVVVTLLGWHAARIAAGLNEWPAPASFLSNWVSGAIPAPRFSERFFVWAHVVVILTFLAYLPYSKHLHIATAAFNVYFSRTRRRGRLDVHGVAAAREDVGHVVEHLRQALNPGGGIARRSRLALRTNRSRSIRRWRIEHNSEAPSCR